VEKTNQENSSGPSFPCAPPLTVTLWGASTMSDLQLLPAEQEAIGGNAVIRSVDLQRQILLHLARFPLPERGIPERIEREARRIAARLAEQRIQAPPEITGADLSGIDLHRTQLDFVDSDLAQAVHKAFHYLGSPRGEGIHLGLFARLSGWKRPRLISLVTLSPFDLWHIHDALPYGIHMEEVLVLSRLFAFDSAPRNTVSFTLGRLFSWLRTRMPHIKALLSYLNPNLGFRGTVYKATNWRLLGEEAKSRYLYIGGNYVTDRHAIRTYGTADVGRLAGILGAAFSTSMQPLLPLQLLIYFLDASLRAMAPVKFGHHFTPDSNLVGDGRK
jgi:hypothetical protein